MAQYSGLTKCYIIAVIIIKANTDAAKICSLLPHDISRQCYMKEVLVSVSHSPNELAVDRHSNTLYFSFDPGQGEYVPAVFQINKKKLNIIKGIKDTFAVTSDHFADVVYFGGSNGIYRYRPYDKKMHRLFKQHLDIWWLWFNLGRIYFIKFPSLTAHYYENKHINLVKQLNGTNVHQFVFDTDSNIFFINNTGLYGVAQKDNRHILLRNVPKFIGMTADNDGSVYVCSEDGIYLINRVSQKIKKVVSVQGVLGLTFDSKNNIIYSDSHELVRLVPTTQGQFYNSSMI